MGNSNSSSGSSSASPNATTSSSSSRPRSSSTSTAILDYGTLEPQAHLYASAPLEHSIAIVGELIKRRRLAPFYLGLEEPPEGSLEAVIEALKEADKLASARLRDALNTSLEELENSKTGGSGGKLSKEGIVASALGERYRERLIEVIKSREGERERRRREAMMVDAARLYLKATVECPICFLYYPGPLIHTRCCDQPICTECFAQIKRADPTATHLESEPAACPFCMEPNFGCIYTRNKDEVAGRPLLPPIAASSSPESVDQVTTVATAPIPKSRRKSFAHTEKQVVTTDQVHPDWEVKLDAIRATVARRANRRIVFRQVGDRLVPVGVTSGRASDGANATMSTTSLPPGFASQIAAALDQPSASSNNGGILSGGGREARRAARRRNEEMAAFLGGMGLGVGPELEELMVMEAMRLSMVEDEARQRTVAASRLAAVPGEASVETERLMEEAMQESLGSASSTLAAPSSSLDPVPAALPPSSIHAPLTPDPVANLSDHLPALDLDQGDDGFADILRIPTQSSTAATTGVEGGITPARAGYLPLE